MRWILPIANVCWAVLFLLDPVTDDAVPHVPLLFLRADVTNVADAFRTVNAPTFIVAMQLGHWLTILPAAGALWYIVGRWLDRLLKWLPPPPAGNVITASVATGGISLCVVLIAESLHWFSIHLNLWCAAAIYAQYLHIRRVCKNQLPCRQE